MNYITIKDITKLRSQTGAGVMDCKKALEESVGNFEKAKKLLAKKGAIKALEKLERETKAGLIEAYIHQNARVGALIKLSCETDFVARNKEFKKLAHEIAMQVAAMKPNNVDQLLAQEYIRDQTLKIKNLVTNAIAKLDENIKIEKFERLEI